jgi:hypothetical protein
MRAITGFAGLLVVLGASFFVYHSYFSQASGAVGTAPPQEQIDVVDIRSNLLTIGQAERLYLVAHGSYGTLEDLRKDGPPSIGTDVRGYVFAAVPEADRTFTVTATPTDPNRAGWPTLMITDAMQVHEIRSTR